MVIQHKEKGTHGLFFVGADDKPPAEMTYRLKSPGVLTIEHTEVSDELRGQNIGYQLVDAAVAYARNNSLKLNATCTFAAKVLSKKAAEYSDVSIQ